MTLPAPATRLLPVPGGRLEYLTTGAGEPVTLFVPGLGGGIPDTRPLGSGVPGTKVFLRLRGHGRASPPARPWRYADLAVDVAAAADAFAATGALGVSLGAGALCRLVAEQPGRFRRLAFYLPAVLDEPRSEPGRGRIRDLAAAIATASPDAVAAVLARELPPAARDTPEGRSYLAQRAATLLGGAGLADAVADLAGEVAVADPSDLRRVTAPALVIGCRGDDLHPVEVASRLAGSLPHATLHVYGEPAPLWTHRTDLRKRISGCLGGR